MNNNQITSITYNYEDEVINALNQGYIDYALLDRATTRFWASQSNGALSEIGQPIPLGLGFGIAVNPSNPILLPESKDSLIVYQNSPAFQKDFETYFGGF